MNVIDDFDRVADQRPDHPCLRWDGGQLTYADVQHLSRRIASGLKIEGLAPGAKGAVLSPNDAYAFVCILGILRAGLVWLPLNPRNSVDDNVKVLASFGCNALFLNSEFEPALAQLQEAVPGLRLVLRIDDGGQVPGSDGSPLLQWARQFDNAFAPLTLAPNHLAAIFATGGTTGKSKGVMHTVASFLAFTTAHRELHARDSEPVFLAAAPVTHVGGRMCLSVIRQGGTVVILPRPDPSAILQAFERYSVTRAYLPPTAIYNLLTRPDVRDYDYSSLIYFIYGGAPMSVKMLREAIDVFGPVMSGGYGQTEAPMAIAQLTPEDHFAEGRLGGPIAGDARLTSCGRPTPYVSLTILDDEGHELERGTAGEIAIRGDIIMLGYYEDSEASREASRFGWHHTGDIGYLDDSGYLHLVDRKRDMIITGGFNVFPSEVEQVIQGLHQVQDCVVVGIPDEKWGEAVKAVVQLVPGEHIEPEEIIAACRLQLGGVKTPKSVEIWPDLPRSSLGKIMRKTVRERFWDSVDRKI